MPIHSVTIGNFKGIAETVTIPIKPITIFIGENSSGKSTVLHALAALSQSPRRSYPTRGANPNQVGAEGESTIPLLANEAVQSKTRQHIHQIAAWLSIMGLGSKVEISRVATSDLFDVSVQLPDGSDFPIADLGYGLSQVLPVLTQLSFAPSGSTLLFEQPELHLHPLAQRPLASVFIDAIRKRDIHIVAETHSSQLITQFHREVRDGKLNPNEIALYRVTRRDGKSHIERMFIDADGEFHKNSIDGALFNDWRNGFCE